MKSELSRWWLAALAVALVVVICPVAALALQPGEILLVTNKNSPDGQRLAALYAQLRQIPPDRTVALDLPDADEMGFDTYETAVVAPLRKYLEDHQLQENIKCLLTFYGVPLRIRAKTNTPSEQKELADLQTAQGDLLSASKGEIGNLEAQAKELDLSYTPPSGDSLDSLVARYRAAIEVIVPRLRKIADPLDREKQMARLRTCAANLRGAEDTPQSTSSTRAQAAKLQALPWDAQARSELRRLTRAKFGLLGTLSLVDAQTQYFQTQDTTAATDSELALLWWNYYRRTKWIMNPLNLHFQASKLPTLMVMRMDGPDPATVERIMRTSIQVEKVGLKGIVALDARGIPPVDSKGNPDPFGVFDQKIRDLGLLLRTRTDLKIRLDDQDQVFPAHSVKNVALYCGWYSVNHYIPGCDFNPGAVGYHIASFELLTLHSPSTEWVRGLLSDGAVATLGPVAEPYLGAFPPPDEFFPLLLTGKLSLAEVYWKTTPMCSWMISCIGDPLYTPYKVNAPMKVQNLPEPLRRAVEPPAPATIPATIPSPMPATAPDSSPPAN